MTALVAAGITVEFDGTRVLDGAELQAGPGEWVSVVGPNGAGKSTLLRVCAGLQRASGTVRVGDQPIGSLSRRELARVVALVPQTPVVPAGMTVLDYVLIGRTAHLSWFAMEGQCDLEAAAEALDSLDLAAFSERSLETLSGGERQRVLLARALAQAAPVLLLDEPTTSLDVGHQQDVLDLVDRLRRDHRLTIVSTMHDLTLAGQYADRLVLLDRGRVAVSGSAHEVLTVGTLERHYGAHVHIVDGPAGPIVVPVRRSS